MPPTVVAVGVVDSATPWVPGLPAGWAQDDVLLIVGENTGGEPAQAATGYAHVTGSPVVEGVNTQLNVLWKRATASESAPTVTGPSNHAVTRMIAIRGCPLSGNPWNVVAAAVEATSDTSATWPGVTTTSDDCLILEIIATGADIATAQLGALTNANYSNIVEQMDNWVTTGAGGGIGLVSATKATKGATGQSTATITTASSKALMTLAFPPGPPPPAGRFGRYHPQQLGSQPWR
ncbi:MAG TPA: hypothetical protein VG276_27925 [Actinomycetes bacterium]|jgi:hypothetical protein|nr:hypothetical protein [Actinomycetes bacterium]